MGSYLFPMYYSALIDWAVTFVVYLLPNPTLAKQTWKYLINRWWDTGVHAFLKDFNQEVNIVAGLGFELAYYDVTV